VPSFPRLLIADLTSVFFIASAALGLGVAYNATRPEPLPFAYETTETRLLRIVAESEHAVRNTFVPTEVANYGPTTVTVEEAKAFQASNGALFVDARPEGEWRNAHISGALCLSTARFTQLYPLAKSALEAARGKRPIVVYCSSSHCGLSELLATILRRLGYADVRTFPGGWEAWGQAEGATASIESDAPYMAP
jgi:rhodanese-related sulfurtransferase